MVRFVVKFKEYLLAVPVVTIAMAVATFIVATCTGMNDTIWFVLCVEVFVILADFVIMIYSLNVWTAMSFFIALVACFYVMVESPFSNVQYVCLVCFNVVLVVANVVLLLHLLIWQITVENDGFSYRTLFSKKRHYKYSEITKIEFFNLGYKVFVGNKRIKCYLHARNNDAFYDQIIKPNSSVSKITF